MVDFFQVSTRVGKRGIIEVYPKFIIRKSNDLMIRGGDFYAIWLEDLGLWSTDEQDALNLIDEELEKYAKEKKDDFDAKLKVMHIRDAETRIIESWHRYCQRDMRDSYHNLDEKLIFANDKVNKRDYASKRLTYPLEDCNCVAYNELMEVLYSPEERHKIEWAIGSIVSGDSVKLQKFVVLYGAAGTGKSTVLNIIQQLFDGYYSVFDAKALGSSSASFALEPFKKNPLVAIQHDGDLSRIEDNTRLNSLVSHEYMTVNEKFKSAYTNKFKCFLFMGTNRPVKITDSKSGLLRRLIDVTPTGEKIPGKQYRALMEQIPFELGGIATHCMNVYLEDPNKYDTYVPVSMLGATNDFYNFITDSYFILTSEDGFTLKSLWEMYKTYCDETRVPYPMNQRIFKEELKTYFTDYQERATLKDGTRVRNYFSGFKIDTDREEVLKDEDKNISWLSFGQKSSYFDDICAECISQYATAKETPKEKWEDITTVLRQLDSSKLHFVKVPQNHIVIDFDIPDENGGKSFEKNYEAASSWPPTYAELSKSGKGIHLHYLYSGDVSKLSRVFSDHIEIKVFTGNSALRRKLTKCNDLPISTISSGLPLKEAKKTINKNVIQSEKGLRRMIEKNLKKEIHDSTKPSVDFIYKILEDAYNSGLNYDVSDMENAIYGFAASSTHQAPECLKLVKRMKFKSEESSEPIDDSEAPIVFFDVEVFPNLFLVNWKYQGKDASVVRMINPRPSAIAELLNFRLIGFNNRRYDNHILYARLMGYTNEQLYKLSQSLIVDKKSSKKAPFFSEAYHISYTDIYDFSSKKQSLKKWEIELGIHHQELGLPWDQPVPEDLWPKVAEYCDNDVIATEAVFDHCQGDFTARKILAEIAGMTVNDTTNTLTTKIIFGNDRDPQSEFNYRDMSLPVKPSENIFRQYGQPEDRTYWIFDKQGDPTGESYKRGMDIPRGYSIMPFFPGYEYKLGKSTYLNEEIGEGGRVYSEPGIYFDVWDGDVSSMHPHSAWEERVFGEKYSKRFKDLVDIRVMIKHKDLAKAKSLLGGALTPYLEDESLAKDLAYALKIAINSVYGLTSASFKNPFRDDNNIDNIVAKRGALFMTKLKHKVQELGYSVAHIKTDSIKIPNADQKIIDFVIDFGVKFGYAFETEAIFDKFCLVNDAVYVAQYALNDEDEKPEWTATGTQFQVPYVFKTLFSGEPIEFSDLCETKSVTTSMYIDMNEELEEGEHDYHFIGRVGCFCPIKPGCGGGELFREKDGKYSAISGTKGYRWLESEDVKNQHKEDDIDISYYRRLVDEAVDTIKKFGDVEQFIA